MGDLQMSNLTKLEVLKHRHLSLLQKLEEHGVSAKFSQLDGEWKIEGTVRDVSGRTNVTARVDQNGFVGAKPQNNKYSLAYEMFERDWIFGVHFTTHQVQLCKGHQAIPVFSPMTPVLAHLLNALEAAMVPASPAKVD
jgi:hypothetical protein